VWHLAVTPDGRTLQAAFGLNTATQTRAWDLTTGRLVAEEDTRGCLGLALSPAGDRSITSTVSIRGVGVEVVRLAGGDRWTAPASQFAVLADGSGLVAGDHKGWRVHDLTGTVRKAVRFPLGRSEELRALACSPDGRHLAAVYSQVGLLIWDLHLGVEKARVALSVPIDRAVYHPAGMPLALRSEEAGGTVYLFEGTTLVALPIGAAPGSLQFCPLSELLFVRTYPPPTIRAWDVTTQTPRCALDFLETSTLSLAGPSDGAWVAAGCLDGTIRYIPGEVCAG
jgi:WD40 repeat protein